MPSPRIGAEYDKALLTRSALDVAEEDARMLYEASGSTGLISRDTFISARFLLPVSSC